MKALFFTLTLLAFTFSHSQKYDCASKTREYQEFLKTKDFNGAFEIWSEASKKCPKESETIYTDGLEILQYKIDNATNPENKEKLVRNLLNLYDQFYKNFPKSVPDYEVKKAMALYNNHIEAETEILALLESGFSKAANEIKDANTIFTYFRLCYEKYKAGEMPYNADATLDRYALVNALLTNLQNSASGNQNDYKTAQRAIDAMSKDLTTCDNLEAYFEKNYNANQNSIAWLTTALTNMTSKCGAKPVFFKMAERAYSLQVSSQSAYFMAIANLKQKKFEESIKFYNQAADLETDRLKKAEIYYALGTGLLANDLTKSKEALNKALLADPNMGRVYLFLAQQYANNANKCGKTEFEKKAIYTLAAQTVRKAIAIEPKLKATVDKMAAEFDAKGLTSSDIAKEKMKGKSLTLGCLMNETITFPAK